MGMDKYLLTRSKPEFSGSDIINANANAMELGDRKDTRHKRAFDRAIQRLESELERPASNPLREAETLGSLIAEATHHAGYEPHRETQNLNKIKGLLKKSLARVSEQAKTAHADEASWTQERDKAVDQLEYLVGRNAGYALLHGSSSPGISHKEREQFSNTSTRRWQRTRPCPAPSRRSSV